MLNRNDIKRMLTDLFRTEMARHQKDALAVFDSPVENLWANIPADILREAILKAGQMFDYKPLAFSSLDLMTDYAYASYLKTKKVAFLTSGSTGTPKVCVHTPAMIWEEARGVAPLFTEVKRIVSLVPCNHLYGFTFTVALPHILNVPVLTLPALPTQSWEKILQPKDLLVGFPLFWSYWLRCNEAFPPDIHVLSSTAPCKNEIIEALLKTGAARFTEIYGSSETGAMAHRHQPYKPFEIFPFWEVNMQADTPRIKRKCGEEWQPLPDKVKIEQERFIYPLERQDACVQVAGINVFPKRIEKILLTHPAVKECRVRLMRPEEGDRLKVFVVVREDCPQPTADELRAFLNRHNLTIHEIPRSFTFGAQLPISDLGKDADW